jgi:hypothetical protein
MKQQQQQQQQQQQHDDDEQQQGRQAGALLFNVAVGLYIPDPNLTENLFYFQSRLQAGQF